MIDGQDEQDRRLLQWFDLRFGVPKDGIDDPSWPLILPAF